MSTDNTTMGKVKPGKCEWCDGECGIIQLHYYKLKDSCGYNAITGWFSPECAWLASCVIDAMENDNS